MSGNWTSVTPGIATIDQNGVVTGISQGLAEFFHTNTNGCTSENNITIVVNGLPPAIILNNSTICPGSTTQMLPVGNGIWTSSNSNIASINNQGVVLGISPGQATFIFTDNDSGCSSEASAPVTVLNRPLVQISGSDSICPGNTSQLIPSSGGSWQSLNPTVASISTSGLVTGLTNGTAQFIFTSFATGCVSMPSDSLEILARPLIQNVGDNELCPGETSLFTSNISGTWSSSNPAVASINGAGLLTAHQNGISVIGFTSSQGCVSSNNITVTVFQNPVISLSGPGSLCPGNQSQVNPSTGGVWTSNNPGIALVSNAGVVTAVSPGVAMIYFTETNSGCTSASQLTITVQQRPAVSITGPNTLCIGNTTQLSPSSGGTWQSLQPGVASVSNNGVVTGISGGTATFRYTSSSGCISDATLPVTVNGKPSINLGGPPSICMGQARQLQPSTGGTWMSSNPSVASVTTNGMVSANFKGNVRFVYTSSGTGCPSDSSAILTINELPNITVIGPPQICKGSTTQLSPTTGGVWTSLTSSTAFISNTGMVIGLNQGTALFQFTQTSTGCTSATPLSIQINPDPVVGFVEDNEICSGTQTNLFPSTGGTWKSNHPDIATVTTDGMVTGISEGFATFTFTNSSGCKGTTTNLFVHNVPVPYVNGPLNMCPGGSTQLQPSQGGIWTSSDQNIAVIDNSGLVTAINPGDVFFIFTDTTTSCISEPMGEFSVFPTPNIDLTGDSLICMNQYSFISANIPGVWLSQNEMIATITNDGMILGKAPGKTGFTFMGSGTGCTYETDDDAISVIQCVDPDFNVTFNNVQVSGNISINDDSPYEMSYGNPMTISKPLQSQEQFLLSPNGQYVFTANKSGKYVYNIPACPPGQISGCPNNYLEITVVNPDQPFTLVTNPDFSYVVENTGQLTAPGYSMYATENDKCAGRIPCHTTNHMVEVIPNATNGITSISQNKIIRFVPQLFYLGQEAIDYKFCEVAGSESCSQSKHFITIQHQNANNSTVASDDFFTAIPGDTISGNVMINDQDPQGDILEIQPIGSPQSMISEPFGSYYLTSDGALFMVVSPDFFGPASITYTLCDQGTPATCTNATIYFLVSGHMTLNIRAYLEGALMNNNNAKTPDGRPLMRDNLRNNPFNNQNYIPVTDPYSIPTNNFDISSNFEHKGCGTLTVFKTILDPENVFSVSGQNAIVDWIFVELRSKNNPGLILATRSGLLQRDGDITDLDGISGLSFPGVAEDSVIVVLKHRNHLGLMSLKMPVDKIIDLTSNTTPVFNYGNTYNALYDFSGLSANQEIAPGYRAMWAGDFDGDGKIKFSNPNDDGNILYYELLTYPENTTYLANYDFAYGYYQGDFDLNGKVKFDNPNDDRNYLLIQLLVYPLNVSIQSNFDFFIEQVIPGQ
jgi:uncharacterized protein YjdB